MKIIVQKFGGTSVCNDESRKQAASHVQKAVKDGYKVIVVVSAMGRNGAPYATDTLINLIQPVNISARERDMLVSCGEIISAVVFANDLNELNVSSVALSGERAGIQTNNDFTNAKIIHVDSQYLKRELSEHDVVVVAGFQGRSLCGHIATLGRGGSDTSATAIAAAVKADRIDIFTDVAGVMTADPRIVAEARFLQTMTYTEICNMAYQGAKVIHPRAVEVAMQANIPLHVRSTYSSKSGTKITTKELAPHIADRVVTGITNIANVTQIKVLIKDGQYDVAKKVFSAMAQEKISVDFINIHPNAIVYTVTDQAADQAIVILKEMGFEPLVKRHCAKVSAVGAGMAGVPGVTAKIVTALSKQNISILQSADSHTTIWVLVNGNDMVQAVNALHQMFRLEREKIEENETY